MKNVNNCEQRFDCGRWSAEVAQILYLPVSMTFAM